MLMNVYLMVKRFIRVLSNRHYS